MGKAAILTPHGPRMVAAQTGGSIPPGLALTLVPMDWDIEDGPGKHTSTRWSITHVESGRRIGTGWDDRKDAQHAAESLAGLADWTVPFRFLADDAELAERVDEALRAFAAARELAP